MNAHEILNRAAGHLADRAKTYDKPEGERSMAAIEVASVVRTVGGKA